MAGALAESTLINFPKGLAPFFDDPPLVGSETRQEYENFLAVIVDLILPKDPIEWLWVKDIVDLSWEIRREKRIKADIIKLYQKDLVATLTPAILDRMGDRGRAWVIDPEKRKQIDEDLADRGHPPMEILARAYVNGAAEIDAIDRRIASYQSRLQKTLSEVERRRSLGQAQRLAKASSDVIEGEFSEAAE